MTMQLSEAAARATLLSGIGIVIDQSAKAGRLLVGALRGFARPAACGWLLTRP